ncbi:hypothetical protein B0H19DRAFT_1167948 [Mycena capillaripes]|nr:hypothetical protein B0H19DRAFT_1167948 [Mycena capillaripes]
MFPDHQGSYFTHKRAKLVQCAYKDENGPHCPARALCQTQRGHFVFGADHLILSLLILRSTTSMLTSLRSWIRATVLRGPPRFLLSQYPMHRRRQEVNTLSSVTPPWTLPSTTFPHPRRCVPSNVI